MPRSSTLLGLTAAVLVLGLLGLVVLRKKPAVLPQHQPGQALSQHDRTLPLSVSAAPSPSVATELEPPTPPTPAVPAPSAAPTALDEGSLMSKLRELRSSDPELTLELAREGNQRFPNSPDAAERSWFIVKSLSDLGRHDEARVEGRKLLERYRDTRWAEDVYRHLFVNPGTHPFERGYGKELELE